MAAIVFPTSPTTNQAYSANGTTWIWDGTTWNAFTPAPSVAWTGGTLDSGNASGSTGKASSTTTTLPGIPSPYGNTGAIMGSNGTQWVINPSKTNINSLGVGTTASGTAGEIRATSITFSDSSTQSSASVYTGQRAQRFTASGTFSVPIGVTAVKVTVLGAGGGGGPGAAGAFDGNGGAAGGCSLGWITGLTPGGTVSVTVGTGGTGGVFGGSGGTGGQSSFLTISANGGGGGSSGAGGTATGGTFNATGNSASNPSGSGVNVNIGALQWGPGGVLTPDGTGTNAPANSGVGGSGGGGINVGYNPSGGVGGSGFVLVEW